MDLIQKYDAAAFKISCFRRDDGGAALKTCGFIQSPERPPKLPKIESPDNSPVNKIETYPFGCVFKNEKAGR